MRIALVSREVYPFVGGGIGAFVNAAALLLSSIAEVTVVTTSSFAAAYEQLRAAEDPRLPPDSVRFAFVEEPSEEEAGPWYDVVQCYGARVLERLRELYHDGGPDVIEFPDYHGEAFVTLQAARALDPFLRSTCVCVRLHTTREIVGILNGHRTRDFRSRVRFEMERYALANADRVIWQGGDILETYRRFYGSRSVAQAVRIRYPYAGAAVEPASDEAYQVGSPLRMLYGGRLERRKGVQNLVRAVNESRREDFTLTLLGGDTDSGPLGVSMREFLRLTMGEDDRIELREAVDRDSVAEVVRQHDVIVIPSLWECWPYAALEAMHLNRPILATPVGGLIELVSPGASGWLAPGTTGAAVERALDSLLDHAGEVEQLVRSGAPIARARALSDERELLDGYQALGQLKPLRGRVNAAPRDRTPLVSAIVPYYRSSAYVADTVASLLAQTHPRLEIVLVNDGSFEEDDWIVAELAARSQVVVVSEMNRGLGAARNFGVQQSRGRYVFPLDADNVAHPSFVARSLEVLEQRPELAYVTSWSRFIEADGAPRPAPELGYQPLGNHTPLVAEENVAGDAAALLPRSVFDAGFRYSEELTSFEDWHFYRELAQAGRFGAVIPERLIYYRIREDSMQAEIAQPRRARLHGEITALLRENEVQWKSSSV